MITTRRSSRPSEAAGRQGTAWENPRNEGQSAPQVTSPGAGGGDFLHGVPLKGREAWREKTKNRSGWVSFPLTYTSKFRNSKKKMENFGKSLCDKGTGPLQF